MSTAVSTRTPALRRLLRPKQWTKNALVFAAPVFARKLVDAAQRISCHPNCRAVWLAALLSLAQR